ncbi:hypothetical protein PSMK_05530 [Phycisphaera mikurensis NBRC 102666]|uniref:Uncharacterized protein n=1 Tax=Phycisphaera mikurensis (strain NBRC 102666 / KCTC 22515 / FYK2301M01) TaxID=1142394 RepID=I0IBS4_PHYMF|nr:hypothetical protein PSMK_05530 [Phycisphaera mikurensis NBRC 102666]
MVHRETTATPPVFLRARRCASPGSGSRSRRGGPARSPPRIE